MGCNAAARAEAQAGIAQCGTRERPARPRWLPLGESRPSVAALLSGEGIFLAGRIPLRCSAAWQPQAFGRGRREAHVVHVDAGKGPPGSAPGLRQERRKASVPPRPETVPPAGRTGGRQPRSRPPEKIRAVACLRTGSRKGANQVGKTAAVRARQGGRGIIPASASSTPRHADAGHPSGESSRRKARCGRAAVLSRPPPRPGGGEWRCRSWSRGSGISG